MVDILWCPWVFKNNCDKGKQFWQSVFNSVDWLSTFSFFSNLWPDVFKIDCCRFIECGKGVSSTEVLRFSTYTSMSDNIMANVEIFHINQFLLKSHDIFIWYLFLIILSSFIEIVHSLAHFQISNSHAANIFFVRERIEIHVNFSQRSNSQWTHQMQFT